MLQRVEGLYQDGKVELLETPKDIRKARVIVAFLPADSIQEKKPQLTPAEIAELRWKLSAWEEDWNAPSMEAYDEL